MSGNRARTVNDYNDPFTLRRALKSVDENRAFTDETLLDLSTKSIPKNPDGDEDDDTASTLNDNWDWVLTNYDAGTTLPQSVHQELHRLQVLKSYMILDSEKEEAFDRLTNMASRVFQIPIALVSLVDIGRQWFMSTFGLDARETPRNVAFCAHAIQGRNKIFVVPDTLEDSRFRESPLVQGPPYIRFYAGAPLLSPEGYKLGTFCIIDSKPRPNGLSEDEQTNLIDFAALAMKAMVDRRLVKAQDDVANLVSCTAHDLLTPLTGVQLSLALLQEESDALTESQKESLASAIRSSDWLARICQSTMESLRATQQTTSSPNNGTQECPILNLGRRDSQFGRKVGEIPSCTCDSQKKRTKHGKARRTSSRGEMNNSNHTNNDSVLKIGSFIDMKEFVQSINQTMETIPKRVPLIVTVQDSVPAHIVSDDLKLFRSSLNLLSNAFANTKSGSVHFQIRAVSDGCTQQSLLFECTDTGEDFQISPEESEYIFKPCPQRQKQTIGGVVKDLGLYSVGYLIDSLGGSFGYRSRADEGKQGSVFWFQVPVVVPDNAISLRINSSRPTTPISVKATTGAFSAVHKVSHPNLVLLDEESVSEVTAPLTAPILDFPTVRLPVGVVSKSSSGCSLISNPSVGLDLLPQGNIQFRSSASSSSTNRRRRSGSDVSDYLRSELCSYRRSSTATSSHGNSCCGLEELSKFADIESYKEHKRKEKQVEENQEKEEQESQPVTGDGDEETHKRSEPNLNPLPLLQSVATSDPTSKTTTAPLFGISNAASKTERPTDISVVEQKPLFELSNPKQVATDGTKTNALFALPAARKPSSQESTQKPLFALPTARDKETKSEAAQKGVAPKTKDPVARPSLFSISPKLQNANNSSEIKQADKASENLQESKQNLRVKKALVIEDTVVVRKTLTRALQKRGYEVAQAIDGVEGLAALKETVFDITLCDFLMPNMDGLDCVQQYREWEEVNRSFKQYIVGISAHVSQKDVDKGLEIGMNAFRPKPITMKTLQELDESKDMDQIRKGLSKLSETTISVGSTSERASSNSSLNSPISNNTDNETSQDGNEANNVTPQGKSCLMATTRSNAESICRTVKNMTSSGWNVTVVPTGAEALEQLKARNWGAVILEDNLPILSGNQCVEDFRAWESQNRVNRQDKVFIVCTDILLDKRDACLLPPAGFDGAVDSQIDWKQLQWLIAKKERAVGQPGIRAGLSIVTR